MNFEIEKMVNYVEVFFILKYFRAIQIILISNEYGQLIIKTTRS